MKRAVAATELLFLVSGREALEHLGAIINDGARPLEEERPEAIEAGIIAIRPHSQVWIVRR